jgi:hypothetical protein
LCFPGRDGATDLELPFPQAGFYLDYVELNALAVHVEILRLQLVGRASSANEDLPDTPNQK